MNTLRLSCILAAAAAVANLAHADDLTWDAGTSTNWNTADANWTGDTWDNATPDNAIFTTDTGAIVLTEAITAGSFTFGNSGINNSGAFSGSDLTINGNLTALALNTNGPDGPLLSFSNNVSIAGDIIIGRRVVEVTAGNFTVNRVLSGDSWGRLLISGGTVTATNGIDDSINNGNTFNVFLQGGSLYTPFIKTTTVQFTNFPSDGVVLNGGTLYATANSSDFIQSHTGIGNWGTRDNVGVGPAGTTINTNGFDITITKSMQNYAAAGVIVKDGAGTLRLTNANPYSGGTTVNNGTLILDGAGGGYARLAGPLTVNPGTTVSLVNDDGTGLGYEANYKVTALTINGGTVTTAGTMHVWNFPGGVTMTGGILQSNNGTSDANGPQMEWINANVTTLASADTATLGGRIRMRADGGATGITFDVADGDAATDLLVSAAITEASGGQGITKSGAGTMVLTGADNYTGTTTVNAGTLALSGTGNYAGPIQLNAGTLSLSNAVIDDVAPVVIANGATVHIGFVGEDTVGSLEIDGSGPLPAGVYDSDHPTYGSYFTGDGSLVVAGSNGTWISLVDGNWSDTANWQSGTIATGYDASATFNAATGVTVTVDSNRKIGNLAFDVSDYTLVGPGAISLESSGTPTIAVPTDRTATIGANLSGTLGMEKTGNGTLVLTGVKTYTGGTIVTGGTLELSGGNSGNSIIRGALTISPGATVSLTGGDGSGFGWNNPVTLINIDGGTLAAPGASHIGFGSAAAVTLDNGASIQGSWQWNGSDFLSVSTFGDTTNTISGNLNLRADGGANHAFNVDDGAAATDLQINANLSDQWPEVWWVPACGLTKNGTGKLVLNGTNTYDGNTAVNDGILEVSATSNLQFRPTTNGATNQVTGSFAGGLSFLGTVNLELGGAEAVGGNVWNLFDLASFSGPTPVLTPAVVTSSLGAFSAVSPGVWELPVTGAKWVFTAGDGNLAYIVTATDFDTWRTANGVTGGENDDDDNDGVSNRDEYAFGLNPTSGSSLNPITVPLDTTLGTFSYTRRLPSLTGLTYSVWVSTDLIFWNEDTGAAEGTPVVNGEVETVPVTLTNTLLSNPSLFIQVRAE